MIAIDTLKQVLSKLVERLKSQLVKRTIPSDLYKTLL
jgi:hypothetical protein